MTIISFMFVLFIVSWVAYIVYGAIYRLYFSPIARFPGPKLAALTRLYEVYYEAFKKGQYVFKIGELHEKYGPIIRINPWELHVNDPDYYDELYSGSSSGKKRDKYVYYTEQFGNPKSMIGTIPHNLHRIRRAPLNRFFSKQSVTRLEPVIQATVDKLISRLLDWKTSEKPVTISLAYNCFTNDIVTEYAFAKSSNFLETSSDFHTDFHDAMVNVSEVSHALKQVPWLIPAMQHVPPWVMKRLDPKIMSFVNFQKDMAKQIKEIMTGQNDNHKSASHVTIFHEVLESNLPPQEKTLNRLWQEGQTIVGAGTETTAWTLSVITYHVLANPEIRKRLENELQGLFTDVERPSWSQLEKLSYLTAVVKEGLRLSFGVTAHLQRVSPDEVMTYKEWQIPPGTPVSMTSVLLHLNPTTFPSPTTFNPDRWLQNPHLDRYLVSFCKGTRICLGMNLAYAEIYLCLANVIMRLPNLELWKTSKEDVEIMADNYVPKVKEGSLGVRVVIN